MAMKDLVSLLHHAITHIEEYVGELEEKLTHHRKLEEHEVEQDAGPLGFLGPVKPIEEPIDGGPTAGRSYEPLKR